jgi:hypothetical protein
MSSGTTTEDRFTSPSSPSRSQDSTHAPHEATALVEKQKYMAPPPEPWLQVYTSCTFNQLHLQIYNIIERNMQ